MKRAFITGITGQDGSYLAEYLLGIGYEVHGLVRRSSTDNTERLRGGGDLGDCWDRIQVHVGDLTDSQALTRLLLAVAPDEIYNLGAQSHVHVSFELPIYTMLANGMGALAVLEAAKQLQAVKPTRVYQASSSEMFGRVASSPQSEKTPFHPRSPYACSKVFAYYQTINYREAYGIFACNGILFNHESPRRSDAFVTRKITRAAARIKMGLQDKLYLGNLDARRDWGYAKDYVVAMWKMLQHDVADDYVIGTGESHSVQEFLQLAFDQVGLDWRNYVEIASALKRPSEVEQLVADGSKAASTLGWQPTVRFEELVAMMMDHDLRALGAT